jgi:hypothetical protein
MTKTANTHADVLRAQFWMKMANASNQMIVDVSMRANTMMKATPWQRVSAKFALARMVPWIARKREIVTKTVNMVLGQTGLSAQ